MNYYVLNEDKEIALFDTDRERLQNTLMFSPNGLSPDSEILTTDREIISLDGKLVFADEHEDEVLEQAKTDKLNELDNISGKYDQYKCDEMYIISSLGYKFNADIRSQTNLQGLISQMVDDAETVLYRDYDNEFRSLNKTDLQTVYGESITNGHNLYKTKWALQALISACKTVEEVDAIEIKFEMTDFTKVSE